MAIFKDGKALREKMHFLYEAGEDEAAVHVEKVLAPNSQTRKAGAGVL